jgi:hypothetical protein
MYSDKIQNMGCSYSVLPVHQVSTQTQWGIKVFDPLLILYVCPLTKKWSVYNFNGRFIWTEGDRITTTKIQKNPCQKCYTLNCILMREISYWPPLNQKDLWLPGVFYTGNKLRLGAQECFVWRGFAIWLDSWWWHDQSNESYCTYNMIWPYFLRGQWPWAFLGCALAIPLDLVVT